MRYLIWALWGIASWALIAGLALAVAALPIQINTWLLLGVVAALLWTVTRAAVERTPR